MKRTTTTKKRLFLCILIYPSLVLPPLRPLPAYYHTYLMVWDESQQDTEQQGSSYSSTTLHSASSLSVSIMYPLSIILNPQPSSASSSIISTSGGMGYVLVPERGNCLFMYGSAPYMNGYLNMNGPEPMHVRAPSFLAACFFGAGGDFYRLRPLYVVHRYLCIFCLSTPANLISPQYPW